MQNNYKQCVKGHYFAAGTYCPFCGPDESQKSRDGLIDYEQTLQECSKCGNWTPIRQRRCMHCGADINKYNPQPEELTLSE